MRLLKLRNVAWGSMLIGAVAIAIAFIVKFSTDWSFLGLLFVAWQTAPVILAALLLRERVMHPITAIVATVAGVSLTLLEILTLDLTSSSTAGIALLFLWFYPVIVVSLCLLAQVGRTGLTARIRRGSS